MATIFATLEEHNPNIVEVTVVDAEREVQEHDADVVEQLVEINEGMDAVSEAFVAIESMMSISDNLKKAIEKEQGISLEAASIAKVSTERICNILGYPSSKPIIPALEAFNPQTGLEATKYALEGLGTFLVETWEAILKFFQDAYDYIKKLWNGIFSANERKKNLIENLNKKLDLLETDDYSPMEDKDAKKKFESNNNKLLTLQNSFRMKNSNIISKNVVDILNTQVYITGIDISKVVEAVVSMPNNTMNVVPASVKFDELVNKINKEAFIDGWALVSSRKIKGEKLRGQEFKENEKKGTNVNSRNQKVISIDDLKLYMDRCETIIENMDNSSDTFEEWKDIMDNVIEDTKENLKNNSGTLTDAEKLVMNDGIKSAQTAKALTDLIFIRMPSLATATISKTLDLVSFHISFYVKDKD